MARIAALELEKDLKEKGLRSVYALVGEDDFLVRRCLSELKRLAQAPDCPGGMATEFGPDAEAGRVFDELRTAPFMGLKGKRLVVLRNAQGFMTRHREALERYINAPASTSTLVICCQGPDAGGAAKKRRRGKPQSGDESEDAASKAKRALVKQIDQKGLVVDCRKLRWREAERWVRVQAQQLGKEFAPRASATLLEAVGTDLSQLENELRKLVDYAADSPVITEREVEEVVSQSRTRSVFDLGDAIASGDAARAFRLCQHLLLRGEELSGLISLLARRTRHLWQIKGLKEAGASQKEMGAKLKVTPFAVTSLLRTTSRLSERVLARHLSILADADYELKTSAIAPREEEAWLMRLVAKLCQSVSSDIRRPRGLKAVTKRTHR